MCIRKKRGCMPCKFMPKRATDYTDLFAQPVYGFTFEDSYVVSSCCGSICTIGLLLLLVYVLFYKVTVYLDNDPSTFTVTEGIEYGYYPADTEFDRHLFAVGLSYRPEFQIEMTELFTDQIEQIVDI